MGAYRAYIPSSGAHLNVLIGVILHSLLNIGAVLVKLVTYKTSSASEME
jgi:hypothetical protein